MDSNMLKKHALKILASEYEETEKKYKETYDLEIADDLLDKFYETAEKISWYLDDFYDHKTIMKMIRCESIRNRVFETIRSITAE